MRCDENGWQDFGRRSFLLTLVAQPSGSDDLPTSMRPEAARVVLKFTLPHRYPNEPCVPMWPRHM